MIGSKPLQATSGMGPTLLARTTKEASPSLASDKHQEKSRPGADTMTSLGSKDWL